MNSLEKQVLDAIDFEGLLSFLQRLITIPSCDGRETTAQEAVALHMEACGLEVDTWELDFDELQKHPACFQEVHREHGLGVVGSIGGAGVGSDLIFNGHIDVVPAGDPANWSYPPWRGTLTSNQMYGRGAVDMKGGLCCGIYAAKALLDAGIRPKGRLLVESVIGEEDGGVGTLATLLRGHRADAAIIMEPTRLAVIPAQAGALNFRLTVKGLSAHGCVRDEGVSAIEKFQPIFSGLRSFEQRRNAGCSDPLFASYSLPYPISVGTVSAGDWASTVPAQLVCEGRYGVRLDEDLGTARGQFEETLAQIASEDPWLAENPPDIEWWGGQFAPAETPRDHAILESVSGVMRGLTGSSPPVEGVPYGADMRLLVNEGRIPTILFGPGDVRQSHRHDEFVPLDDLLLATRALALTAMRYCGVGQKI